MAQNTVCVTRRPCCEERDGIAGSDSDTLLYYPTHICPWLSSLILPMEAEGRLPSESPIPFSLLVAISSAAVTRLPSVLVLSCPCLLKVQVLVLCLALESIIVDEWAVTRHRSCDHGGF